MNAHADNFLHEVALPKETLQKCWGSWKEIKPLPLPTLPCNEVKQVQPVLTQVVQFLAEWCRGRYRVFSNKGLDRGLYRPDISIALADEAFLFFRFLVSTIEAKTDLEETHLMHEAVGQLNSYISSAAFAQTERTLFYGAITDLRKIHFFKFDRRDPHKISVTPYHPMDFVPNDYGTTKEPTPGFEALMRLFSATPSQLGYPDPPLRPRSFGKNDLREHLGSGGSSSVYTTDEGVIKISAGGDIANRCLTNEIKVLEFLNKELGESVPIPKLTRSGLDDGKMWMTLKPRGTPLMSFICDPADDDVKYYFEIARSLVFTLEAVHKTGLLHLDVRPSNVVVTATQNNSFVDWRSQVYLIDWGLAHSNGESAQNVMGVAQYQSTAWLTDIENGRCHTLSFRDDLESVAYLVLDLLHTLPTKQTGDFEDFILERKQAANKQTQIRDYLRALDEMTREGTLEYHKLANIIRGGQAAANDEQSPVLDPKRCQYYLKKQGRKCANGISLASSSYCHIHMKMQLLRPGKK
jgi:serine/threonine protein kinase